MTAARKPSVPDDVKDLVAEVEAGARSPKGAVSKNILFSFL